MLGNPEEYKKFLRDNGFKFADKEDGASTLQNIFSNINAELSKVEPDLKKLFSGENTKYLDVKIKQAIVLATLEHVLKDKENSAWKVNIEDVLNQLFDQLNFIKSKIDTFEKFFKIIASSNDANLLKQYLTYLGDKFPDQLEVMFKSMSDGPNNLLYKTSSPEMLLEYANLLATFEISEKGKKYFSEEKKAELINKFVEKADFSELIVLNHRELFSELAPFLDDKNLIKIGEDGKFIGTVAKGFDDRKKDLMYKTSLLKQFNSSAVNIDNIDQYLKGLLYFKDSTLNSLALNILLKNFDGAKRYDEINKLLSVEGTADKVFEAFKSSGKGAHNFANLFTNNNPSKLNVGSIFYSNLNAENKKLFLKSQGVDNALLIRDLANHPESLFPNEDDKSKKASNLIIEIIISNQNDLSLFTKQLAENEGFNQSVYELLQNNYSDAHKYLETNLITAIRNGTFKADQRLPLMYAIFSAGAQVKDDTKRNERKMQILGFYQECAVSDNGKKFIIDVFKDLSKLSNEQKLDNAQVGDHAYYALVAGIEINNIKSFIKGEDAARLASLLLNDITSESNLDAGTHLKNLNTLIIDNKLTILNGLSTHPKIDNFIKLMLGSDKFRSNFMANVLSMDNGLRNVYLDKIISITKDNPELINDSLTKFFKESKNESHKSSVAAKLKEAELKYGITYDIGLNKIINIGDQSQLIFNNIKNIYQSHLKDLSELESPEMKANKILLEGNNLELFVLAFKSIETDDALRQVYNLALKKLMLEHSEDKSKLNEILERVKLISDGDNVPKTLPKQLLEYILPKENKTQTIAKNFDLFAKFYMTENLIRIYNHEPDTYRNVFTDTDNKFDKVALDNIVKAFSSDKSKDDEKVKEFKKNFVEALLTNSISLSEDITVKENYHRDLVYLYRNEIRLDEVSPAIIIDLIKANSSSKDKDITQIDETLMYALFGDKTPPYKNGFDPYKHILDNATDPKLNSAILKYMMNKDPKSIEKPVLQKSSSEMLSDVGFEKIETYGDLYVYNSIVGLKNQNDALIAAELLLKAYDNTDDKNLKKSIENYYNKFVCQINNIPTNDLKVSNALVSQYEKKILDIQDIDPKLLAKYYKQGVLTQNINNADDSSEVTQVEDNKKLQPVNLLLFGFKFLHSLKTEYDKNNSHVNKIENPKTPNLISRLANYLHECIRNIIFKDEKIIDKVATDLDVILTTQFLVPQVEMKLSDQKHQYGFTDNNTSQSIKTFASQTQKVASNIISKHEEKTTKGITKKELKDRSSGNNGGLII